jgi:hypothetical protein
VLSDASVDMLSDGLSKDVQSNESMNAPSDGSVISKVVQSENAPSDGSVISKVVQSENAPSDGSVISKVVQSKNALSDGSVKSMDVPNAKCIKSMNAPSDESVIPKDVQSNVMDMPIDVPSDGSVKSMDVLSDVSNASGNGSVKSEYAPLEILAMPFVGQCGIDEPTRGWTGGSLKETAGDFNLPTRVKVCLCMHDGHTCVDRKFSSPYIKAT